MIKRLRLPVSRARHDKELDRHHELLIAAYDLIAHEHRRAMNEGISKVHRFMVDANAELYNAEGTSLYVAKVRAVFQQAEREFRVTPLTMSERMHCPANIEEALNAVTGS